MPIVWGTLQYHTNNLEVCRSWQPVVLSWTVCLVPGDQQTKGLCLLRVCLGLFVELDEFHLGRLAGSSGGGRVTLEGLIGPANGLLGAGGLVISIKVRVLLTRTFEVLIGTANGLLGADGLEICI